MKLTIKITKQQARKILNMSDRKNIKITVANAQKILSK